MFGNTGASARVNYSHDALDNLTYVSMPATALAAAREWHYCYDAHWRLTSLRTADGCAGTSLVGLAYDPQGNLASKGGDSFTFGKNNRLYFAPSKGELYYYDAQGHRTLQNASAGNILSQYTQDGQLMQITDNRSGFTTSYVSLGGSLVAARKRALSGGAVTVEYQHTDALGTPVAVTNASRTVIERSDYEPYGQVLNRAQHDGPGFTGHVQDAMTGLTYMQQRYYDPQLGKMLSVDPVTAYDKPLTNFNRYFYANNNPYRFTDPDGRQQFPGNAEQYWNALRSGASSGMLKIQSTAKEYAPRVVDGVTGVIDMGLGGAEVVAGVALTASSAVDGGGFIAGVPLTAAGALTASDGLNSFRNALDGGDRHTTLGEFGKSVAGDRGALVGDAISAVRDTSGAAKSVAHVAEAVSAGGVSAGGVVRAAYENASAAKSATETDQAIKAAREKDK
jgi:RHS repeat-associated protein